MATIFVDGEAYEVDNQDNLLQACLKLGLDLPYFCWHPELGSVGACRQCAVIQYQNEEDERGRLVMSCMTPVGEGLRISIQAKQANNFRAGVIETLMTNHPHDCPVCEEGGECHLQDMTIMTGHRQRRYRGDKRTFTNQQLGPFINHEMNRCITCYRCVRFYQEYAGGTDLHALSSRNRTYFGRFEEGSLESEFSGNLVEVCPTGVFTDKTLSDHYSRKWDLQCAPSVCAHCSLGCNISPGERYGELKRIQNRYHPEVNGYFLCDRGRFGYGFVNHPDRIRTPRLKIAGGPQPEYRELDHIEAQQQLSLFLENAKGKLIGIGSPRASLESNFALRRLVGEAHFYSGLSRREDEMLRIVLSIMQSGQSRNPSLKEMEDADAMLILGEDITQSAPRMALSLRQAVRNRGRSKAASIRIPKWQDHAVRTATQTLKSPCYITSCSETRLDDVATATYRNTPDEQARLGFAVAHLICPEAPAVSGLTEAQQALAGQIAASLKIANRPLIITGTGSQSPSLIKAAAQVAQALSRHRTQQDQSPALLSFALSECNSLGLTLLNDSIHENQLDDAFEAARHGKSHLIIMENDLYRRAPAAQVEALLASIEQLVVLDDHPHRTAQRADLLLPTATFAESQGTLINNEGRAQYLYPVYPMPDNMAMSGQWLSQPKRADGPEDQGRGSPESLLSACTKAIPAFSTLKQLQPDTKLRVGGMKFPRMSHRYSGRTAMRAHISVHEPKQPVDSDSSFAYTMEGVSMQVLSQASLTQKKHHQKAHPPPPFAWYPGWNSNQAISKFHPKTKDRQCEAAYGVKLVVPFDNHTICWFKSTSPPQQQANTDLLIVPRLHIFGSEELSSRSSPIIERTPTATIGLHPEDALSQGLDEGDLVTLKLSDQQWDLPLRIDHSLAMGIAQIPWNREPLTGIELPALGRLELKQKGAMIASDRRDDHA
jgi:NADH-quinone oxidoreductase subunit G